MYAAARTDNDENIGIASGGVNILPLILRKKESLENFVRRPVESGFFSVRIAFGRRTRGIVLRVSHLFFKRVL